MLLFAAGVLAVLVANSPLAGAYAAFLDVPLTIRLGSFGLDKPLLLWINDLLMAIFFLLVGLEIKREIVVGELSDPARIALPAIAALGGMLVPAAIYASLNASDPVGSRGWAIPSATDIAFALGLLSLFGARVPLGLKILLMTLAVLDDLGAIVIIALFYTNDLSWIALASAAAAVVVLAALNRAGVMRIAAYVLVGAVLWVCVLKSGVHATLAGVVTALFIPARGAQGSARSPLTTLEHSLHPWVAYAILPVFAFANAGVSLAGCGSRPARAGASRHRAGAVRRQADRGVCVLVARPGARLGPTAAGRDAGADLRHLRPLRDRLHDEPLYCLARLRYRRRGAHRHRSARSPRGFAGVGRGRLSGVARRVAKGRDGRGRLTLSETGSRARCRRTPRNRTSCWRGTPGNSWRALAPR
jgi:Na+/H+ antiporter NhaA